MDSSRRDFVHQVTAGAVGLSGVMAWGGGTAADLHAFAEQNAATWNVSWADKLKGKQKAVFDCIEPESGLGVWRAGAWSGQVAEVLKAAPADISLVIVLRHAAIALAMSQAFWDKYKINADKKITNPLTQAPTDKNPVLLDERDGVPAPFNMASLPKQQARGATVLACNLALSLMIAPMVKAVDKVSDDEAYTRAVAGLLPGVILQPSGVFGVVRAQQAGCAVVSAS
jgi:hypothetical protein